MKKSFQTIFAVVVIATASVLFAGCQKEVSSNFLMLDDAKNITKTSETQEIYHTQSDLDGILSFYREKLGAEGLAERELLTVQTETTLNLVFDGSENGKALVIQAVVIGDYTNVTIRYEEV